MAQNIEKSLVASFNEQSANKHIKLMIDCPELVEQLKAQIMAITFTMWDTGNEDMAKDMARALSRVCEFQVAILIRNNT